MAAAGLYQRKGLLIELPVLLLAAVLAAFLWQRYLPLPPAEITLSSGRTDGVYHAHALRYADAFARHGITVHVVPSDGSEDNLRRLRGQAQPPADLAFLQGGAGTPGASRQGAAALRTIARIDLEPVWIFARAPGIEALQQLQGLRVSLGPRGSGTRKLALQMLEQVRVAPRDLVESDLAGAAAARALRAGELDALVMVASASSPIVRDLLQAPGVHLVQLTRAAALIERLPWLQLRLLPQGAMDPQGRQPPQDVSLPVTTASLVARDDLHPALQRLAAAIAAEVHGGPGLLHKAGEFPNLRRIEFPASRHAREVHARGLPWLEAGLPFWTAQVLLRLLVVVLPVALLAWWAGRMLPAWVRWSLESRLARWYGELKYIEHDLARNQVSGRDLQRYLEDLAAMERRVAGAAPPDDLVPRWLVLRQHIDLVRMGLYRQRGR